MRLNLYKSVLVVLFAMLGIGSTYAQLSGNYTIGTGTGYDYSSVTAAVSDLTSNGVNGAATFTIADGTYSGTLSFGSGISGASATNTITFKSASADSSKVLITSTNYTVYMTGADYINFEGMTFRTTNGTYNIYLNSASNYNTFKNCRIQGQGSSYTFYNIYNYRSEYNQFIDTKVEGGYYAFYNYGSGTGSSASEGTVIDGCSITKHYYYGVYAYYQREMTFSNNYVDSCLNSGYGVMAYYSDAFTIENNEIYGTYYGLYLYYHNYYGSSTDSSYLNNNILRQQVYYGLYSYYMPRCLVYHNVFEGGSGNYSAIFQYLGDSKVENNIFYASGPYYGFYCYYGSTADAPAVWDYNDYWFTSPTYFAVFGNRAITTFAALQSFSSAYNQNCVTIDPDFANSKEGRTYAPGLNNIGHDVGIDKDIDGNTRPNKLDGKVDIGPNDFYLAPYDLDVFALVTPLSVGTSANQVTAQFRNSGSQTITSTDVYVDYSVDSGKTWTVDTMSITSLAPGKVQQFDFSTTWTPTRTGYFGISIRISKSVTGDPDLTDQKDYYVCSGLSGSFTIGARAGADFASVADAVKALRCGVAGPIVFNIQGGSYAGPFKFGELSGASATNTVTFRSPSVDSVTLYHNATSTTDQNTIYLAGCDYVAFENMKIESRGSYGFAVHISNDADYNRFEGCVISCNTGVTSTYSNPIVFSSSESSYSTGGRNGSYNQFIDNHVIGGYFSICMYGSSGGNAPVGNEFHNNKIERSYYYGVYSFYGDGLVFHDNTIDNFRYQYNYCFYSYYASNPDIQRNSFTAYYGNFFGYMNYYDWNNTPSTVANNMFMGDNASYAIYGYYMSHVNFYHNSMYGKGSYLCYWYYMNDMDIRNNIFYYSGSNYAIYTYNPTFRAWDYNDYYITSGNLIYLGGTVYSNVAALKGYSTSYNQNNFDEDPEWVTPGEDHHVTSKFPEMYGANVGVALDHDKDSRCKFAPSVGADEFVQTQLPPVANFLAPDTAWLGSPTVLLNSNKASKTTGALWYVNGTLVSDSIHLEYTPTNTGYDTISLVMENCSGTDSIGKLVFVSPILRAPKVDFSSSSKDVYTGDLVSLLDLSSNGPTQWSWDISPKVVYDPFLLIWSRTHWYANNDSSKANPQVRFDYPGVYTVKLKVANSFGADSLVRTSYIKVRQKATMCDIPWDTDGSYGTLFDNGGEFGNYSPGLNGLNKCTYLISSCKGEIDLDISQFDVAAGDYLQIYDGTDASSRPMWDAVNYPDGMNGNKSDKSVRLTLTAQSGSAYFVFTSDNNNQTTGKGFAINWEIDPVSWSAPTASISMPDTACLGFPTYFENTSTGNWSFIEWDLNADSTVDGTNNTFGYTFTTPGYHVIKLISYSLCAPRDSIIDSIFIESAKKAPAPDFTTSATLVAAGDTVMFEDQSDYCASKTEWTITPSSYLLANNTKLTDMNLDVVFLRGGFYTIELTKGNTFGEDSIVKVNHIQVLDYCTPSVANLDPDLGISRVVFGDIDNSSQAANIDYSNFLSLSTTVEKGLSYPISVERATANKDMSRKVWIDWNIDGDFDDTGELVSSEAPAKTLVYNDTIMIPSTATAGKSRMRVSTNYSTAKNLACGPHQFGEFEDYTIVISDEDKTPPVLTLMGALVDTVDVGTSWTEPGYTAIDLLDGNLTSSVSVNSSLDVNTTGVYEITYSVSDAANNTATAKRSIRVIDANAPVIALNGTDTVTIEVNTSYTEAGTTESDNYDTNLKVEITSNLDTASIGTYTINYCVTDNDGNGPICVERTVIVEDTQTPIISLNGNATETVEVFTVYTDAGVTVTDNDNFAVANSGTWMGSTDVVGTYEWIYTATDMAGNNASITRTIEVVDTEAPVIALTGNALVTVARWADYTDEGYEVSDNYYDASGITVTQGGDFEDTQSEGIYELTYSAVDNSGNTSATVTRVVVVSEALANGINEIELNSMTVYPNPSAGQVNLMVNITTPEVVTVRVLDALGKELMNNRYSMDNNSITSLDMSSLGAGVYFIEVSGADFTSVKPVNINK